ncbi:LysE family translocator [Paracoccus niistensis]|uniref:LysE family translocator n=2 Tax=Paracoccus niistensis TaxID=632935 RepID=A0ABV6I0G8_9RHOB
MSAAMLQFMAAYIVVVPGPVALTMGGYAALHGFRRTIPLLAGIAMGTATLMGAIAWSAIHLASGPSLPTVQAAVPLVLIWLAGRLLRSARAEAAGADMPPPRLWLELFAQDAAVAFLAPQSASLFTIAFLEVFRDHDRIATLVAVTTSMSIAWYTLIALLFSLSSMRWAALQYRRIICRAAAAGLLLMAMVSVLSTRMTQMLP